MAGITAERQASSYQGSLLWAPTP